MESRIPKKTTKKSSCALAERNFCLVANFKDAAAFPAPTRYNPGVRIFTIFSILTIFRNWKRKD